MQAVFTQVATALNAVAAAEDDSAAQLPSPAPAPQRFAAAVQAALASEGPQTQGCVEQPSSLCPGADHDLFWHKAECSCTFAMPA